MPSTAAARTRRTSASSHDVPNRRRSVTKQRTGPLLFDLFMAAKRERSSLGVTGEKDGNQLDESGAEIDHAQPRHRAAHEVVPDDGVNDRHRFGKVVPIPERGPWDHEQRYSELEEKR